MNWATIKAHLRNLLSKYMKEANMAFMKHFSVCVCVGGGGGGGWFGRYVHGTCNYDQIRYKNQSCFCDDRHFENNCTKGNKLFFRTFLEHNREEVII